MAINIPGLSLSILRQQTTVQSGLPLLVSGRFTAFGIGMPAYIRVFLEGPSYDPQIRSFDTFSSPFSGDYSVNVIAEKDGSYNVYAQAMPPPLLPTGPPLPEAILLLPAIAESTHPPLAVGFPFDGGVEALLPDGSRQRIDAPAMQPIEFRPLITVGAPSVFISGLGEGAAPVAAIPWYPTAPEAPWAPPGVPTYARAVVDDLLFSPSLINPGMEATGVMAWRNTGEAPTQFDSVFYLISPEGVRYGPLQVNQNVSANPQIPATQNLRLSTEGLPSGVYSVVAEIYDSATGAFVASRSLPSRLEIREIAAPVPPVIPPPVIPVTPTLDILGTPSLYLPGQVQVGDVWAGSVSLPTFSTVPIFIDSRLLLRDAQGYEYIVAQGGRTLYPAESLQVPVNLDTSGFPVGSYTILLRAFDQAGNMIAEFPMGALSMIAAALPEIPVPVLPPPIVPEAPTLPTYDMFSTTPSVYLPSELEIGEIWQGNITIPTMVPAALQAFPSLPAYPVNIGLKLQSPIGQMFDVGSWQPSFTPGQNINLPVNFDTSALTEQGINNLILNISDLQGNPLFSKVIGSLRSLMPAIPELPEIPEVPVPHAGTIIKKELEYNESRRLIPAYNVPQGERGKVHIWGRNDTPTRQKLGIHWIVQDPDGLIAEDYQDWQFMRMDPGSDHEFISPGRFDFNKPGTWTISISLSMNPDAPLTVDSYAGVLCTVTPTAPPPEAPPAGYTLEVAIEPPGAGHVVISSKGPYSAGEVVTLVATPYPGYEFDHWGGWPPYPGVQSTSDALKLTMTANWWVVAAFREVAPGAVGAPYFPKYF